MCRHEPQPTQIHSEKKNTHTHTYKTSPHLGEQPLDYPGILSAKCASW